MEMQLASGGSVTLSDSVFGKEFNETLVHQAVVAYMAAGRSGTKAQKNRSAVSGGGAKPFRQKGTGRARAGTSRGPIWRKGGVTFAARPRDYAQKLNQKMYRAAIRSIFSELARTERLTLVEDFDLEVPKTSALISKLSGMSMSTALIVDAEPSANLFMASRNIPGVEVADIPALSPVALVSFENVVMTKAALAKVEEWLS